MNYLDIEEAKKLVSGPFGEQLKKIAIDCCAPLFWAYTSGSKIIRNGTIFFIDTGTHRFAVSACHVYKQYLDDSSRFTTVCQIAGERFNPEDALIDYSDSLDLVTFNVGDELVKKIGKQFLRGSQKSWPPSPPQIEKGMIFAGFPGVSKEVLGQHINWGIFRGLCIANSVGDEFISIQFDPDYAVDTQDRIPQGFDAGGMSGAPLITLVESEGGVLVWRLGGVIYEAQSQWDVMLARHASSINDNGTLNQDLS